MNCIVPVGVGAVELGLHDFGGRIRPLAGQLVELAADEAPLDEELLEGLHQEIEYGAGQR